ncbi:MAG: ParB N-terminal domain-containing protein, partial [Synergistaceae bacterium]|nr:ParB N-terminal domain-containing protein [Synergistaceae bacterium]
MMEDRELLGQVKYKASDVKEVDISQIIDLAVVRKEQLKDDEADLTEVKFRNPFDVPNYDSEIDAKAERDMTVAEKDMKELVRGIREFGVLVPLLVRKTANKNEKGQDQYELLSGYRRKKAVDFINESLPEEKKMMLPIIEVPGCDVDDDKAIVVLT